MAKQIVSMNAVFEQRKKMLRVHNDLEESTIRFEACGSQGGVKTGRGSLAWLEERKFLTAGQRGDFLGAAAGFAALLC
jgi:hypothetical protein